MLPLERAEPPVMAAFLQRPSLLARWAGDGAGQVAGIKLQTSHERLPLQLRWVNQNRSLFMALALLWLPLKIP